jgi:membrane-associated protein
MRHRGAGAGPRAAGPGGSSRDRPLTGAVRPPPGELRAFAGPQDARRRGSRRAPSRRMVWRAPGQRRGKVPSVLRMTTPPASDPAAPGPEDARPRGAPPVPWQGAMQRADKILLAGIMVSGLYYLALLPLVPALVSSHPALLEVVRGSTASIINMGARARVGQTSLELAVLLALPSLMMFDWVFWWAGRRWGDRVFVWLLGGEGPRTERRLARLHRLESRFGPLAVVLAYVLPIPSTLIYAAVGDGGMRLSVFLLLDLLGTVLWAGLLAMAGYGLGQSAVDVADAVSHYSLWVTIALVVVATVWSARGRAGAAR